MGRGGSAILVSGALAEPNIYFLELKCHHIISDVALLAFTDNSAVVTQVSDFHIDPMEG